MHFKVYLNFHLFWGGPPIFHQTTEGGGTPRFGTNSREGDPDLAS